MSHQPEPLTRAAILKLEGLPLCIAVAVARGGKLRPHLSPEFPDKLVLEDHEGRIIGTNAPGKWVRNSSGPDWDYDNDWNAAGELLGLLIAAGYAVTTMHHSSAPDSPWHLTAWKQHPGPGPAMIQATGPFPIMAARAFLLSHHNPQA